MVYQIFYSSIAKTFYDGMVASKDGRYFLLHEHHSPTTVFVFDTMESKMKEFDMTCVVDGDRSYEFMFSLHDDKLAIVTKKSKMEIYLGLGAAMAQWVRR